MSAAAIPPARQKMIDEQLRARGITDPRVLRAMALVPREQFASGLSEAEVYADRAWPIDCEQTISQPYMVALMTAALGLTGRERVLEIGTGSGYQTAILSYLASHVVSIERHAALSAAAEVRLQALRRSNVKLIVGDGSLGWPPQAPYDAVLVAAASEDVPPPLLDQLADRGRLVIPVGPPGNQELRLLVRAGNHLTCTNLTACRFVPLVSGEPNAAAENADE